MKKYTYIIVVLLFALSACNGEYEYNLKQMGKSLKEHIQRKDLDNNTVTKIESIIPISYDKVPDNEKSNPQDAYLAKILLRSTWSYMGGNRVYNVNDTLQCYFNDKFEFVRLKGE